VARTAEAFTTLTNQLRAHRAEREYIALVSGTMAADEGTIDAPIGRSSRAPTRMALTPRGRPARTGYRVRGRYRTPAPTTLLDVRLETGRTHQVRVHLAAIGHPVVGDQRYAGVGGQPSARGSTDVARLMPAGRVFLHAARLSVDHPNGVRMTWESPLPADLVEVLAHLGT
jgi:23S rRNA pseudouridine1911/1915/1917 synthase